MALRSHSLTFYTEEFLQLTCPTTHTGYAKLDGRHGVIINGLHYHHPLMNESEDVGKRVPVRYEPFNMARAYAFVEGQWLPCTADIFLLVEGCSEREWEVIVDEMRAQQRQHGKKRVTVNGPLLAQFLEEVATEEQLLLQQQRDLEGQSIREAIDRTNVLHVLAGPYALFGFRNTSGQLARRGRDIHFQRYHVNDKEERKAFAGAVRYLLERVPLTCDVDAFLKCWRWFAEDCVGCVGILRDWLVDAVTATLAQGGTRLTEEVLTQTMPHPARRVSLEMEARAGEHKVALHDSEGAKQFQARLQKPGKAANAEATPTQGSRPRPTEASIAEPASVTRPLPQISPKPTQPRVGQRAPERDPVGRTSVPSARKTSGCSFAEEIPVTLVQIEEVGVSRFECPTCLAVREIRPKGDRVKFPSHPKRMTTQIRGRVG